MARSLWIGTIVAVLGSAWLVLGQSGGTPAPAPSAGPSERILTVQEENRPAQKCKVIKTWRMADGAQAMQVQALDTGELMTIVEEGGSLATSVAARGERVRTLTTRIFHWGPSKSPPPGVPLPPPTVMVKAPEKKAFTPPPATVVIRPEKPTAPPPPVVVKAPEKKAAAPVVVAPPVTKVTSSRPVLSPVKAPFNTPPVPSTGGLLPALSASSARSWPAAHGNQPEVVAGRNDPSATMPPPPLPSLAVVPRVANQPMPSYLTPQRPVAAPEKVDTGERGLLSRIFGGPTKTVRTVRAPSPEKPSLEPVSVAQAKPTKSSIEPAQPADWRQSWGKVESKTEPSVKNEITRTEARQPEKKPAAPKAPVVTKPLPNPTSPAAAASTTPPPRILPPRADTTQPDPLKEPASYGRHPVEAPAAPKPEPKPETKPSEPTPAAPPVPQPTAGPVLPAGAGSVLAAGQVQYVPVPIVTTPNVMRMPQQPPQPNVPQAPQPNQQVLAHAYRTGAYGAPSAMRPEDMVNAFTPMPAPDESSLGGAGAYPDLMMHPAQMQAMQMQAMQQQAMHLQAMLMARGMVPQLPTAPMTPPAMLPPVQPVGYQGVPQSVVQASGGVPDMQQALSLLSDSLYPSQREWAADKLSGCKWKTSPHVVQALLTALKDDPAPSVRAACVRSLAKMDANVAPVLQALESLKADPEEMVRREAELALSSMSARP